MTGIAQNFFMVEQKRPSVERLQQGYSHPEIVLKFYIQDAFFWAEFLQLTSDSLKDLELKNIKCYNSKRYELWEIHEGFWEKDVCLSRHVPSDAPQKPVSWY